MEIIFNEITIKPRYHAGVTLIMVKGDARNYEDMMAQIAEQIGDKAFTELYEKIMS